MVVQDSLPFGGDQDSTLVQTYPEDWINTPMMMDLLDREGPAAPSVPAVAEEPAAETKPEKAWQDLLGV